MTGLSGMAAHVARRVERLKKDEPLASVIARPLYARTVHEIPAAIKRGVRVAEIRFADPQGGLLVPRENATPEEAARRAVEAAGNGALAVAVWVERNFHAGDYSHLEAARAACPELCLIARDLVMDLWQIDRARAAGADAVELIPELLGPALDPIAAAVRKRGLAPVAFGPGPTVRVL
jgi:indole-3-glycerol phosphate synthase